MADLTLTVFDVDDATALFEVGTSRDHANPYLEEPEDLVASEIDLLNGGGYIGGLTVRVIDPQTGATQAERWLTSRLGVPTGQIGEGHSQLKGHRALLQTSVGRTLMDGTITHVRLNESYAGFTLTLKDIRERPRKVAVFTSAARRDAGGAIVGAPTVLPRGRMEGYGQLPLYRVLPTSLQNAFGWTIPPATPLTARVDDDAGLPILNLIPTEWPADWHESKNFSPGLVATDAIRDVCSRLESEQEGNSYFNTFPDVRVLWRNNSTEAWREVEVAAWGVWSVIESSVRTVAYRGSDENGNATTIREDMPVISTVHLGSSGTMPTVGTTVEFLLVYVGEPESAYPYTFEGTAGDFLADLYDGQMSEHDPRTRYDAAAVATITTPIRVRQPEKRDNLRDVEEEVYRAIGYAPAVIDGLVTPVSAEYPPPGATLPEITDDNAMPVPGWEDDTSSAVTEVVLTYHRDFRVGASNDPLGRRSDGDGVGSREVTHRVPAPDWAIDLVGDNPHEIDGWIFRALGGVEGSAIAGDVMDETGARIAVNRGHRVLDRWPLGGQISAVRVRADEFPVRVGDWVEDSRSWRPNYNTLQRGGPVLAQIMSLQPDGDAWLDLVLVDAGPSAQPLAAPTVGALSADSDGAVTVPITGVPTGASAEVRYAINDTEPAAGSSLWTPGGRREGDGNIVLPQAPAGATVWVEARSVAIGRRPSDWTAAASVAITSTPRVTDVSATARDDGSVLFQWDPNVAAAGVRIHYEAHAPGATPTLPNSVDVDGSAGSHTLAAGTVDPTQVLTADVEPWTGWSGTAVSGTAGTSVRVTASRGAVVGALTASVVFSAANEAIVQANAPAGTQNIYITVGVDADPLDPSSNSHDATIAGDSGRVNTGVVVAEKSVAHVKVRADSGPVELVVAKNTGAPSPVAEISVYKQSSAQTGIRYAGSDGTGGHSEAVEYQRRIDVGNEADTSTIEGAWSAWAALPAVETVDRLPFHAKWVYLRVRDADGNVSPEVSVQVPSRLLSIKRDTGRVYQLERGPTLDEPTANLFKRGVDTAGDIVEDADRSFIIPTYVDSLRRVNTVRRGTVDESPANLFKRGTDTLEDVLDTTKYRRTTVNEANQTRRATQNLLGPDAGPVQDGSGYRYDVTLEDSRLAVGDEVAAGLDLNNAVDGGYRLYFQFLDGAGALLETYYGAPTGVGWERSEARATIPTGTATIRLKAGQAISSPGATQTRRAMLNRGLVPLPFEEPPFRAQREDADVITETADRSYIIPTYVDSLRRVNTVRRGTTDESPDNLFKRGVDTAADIIEDGDRSFIIPTYVDSLRRVNSIRRGTTDESPDNLFKRGSDTAADVVETAGQNFIHADNIDANRRVDAVKRGTATAEPTNNLFKRGVDELADVVGGSEAEAQANSKSQNLGPHNVGDEISSTGSPVFSRRAFTPEEAGLKPGDVISAMAEVKTDDPAVGVRFRMVFIASTNAYHTSGPYSYSTDYVRLTVDNRTIPEGCTWIRIEGLHENDTAVAHIRYKLVNRGPRALPGFEEPPFRVRRETLEQVQGNLREGATQTDGVAQRIIAKGHVAGSGFKDGDAVSFPQAFQGPPMVLLRGGLTYSTDLGSGVNQIRDVSPNELTAQGFKMRAKILSRGGVTHEIDPFGTGTLTVVGATIQATIDPGGAAGGDYDVDYNINIDSSGGDGVFLEVAIDTYNGSAWTERALLSYVTGPGETINQDFRKRITVTSTVTAVRMRLVTKDMFGTGVQSASVDPHDVEYDVSTDNEISATPAGVSIAYEAMAVD